MARTAREVNLTPEVRKELEQFTTTGVRSVRLLKRAKIVLALDVSLGNKPEKEEEIARRVEVSRQIIQNVKNDFFASVDICSFLQRKKREIRKTPEGFTNGVCGTFRPEEAFGLAQKLEIHFTSKHGS